jgi:hypothetical protein
MTARGPERRPADSVGRSPQLSSTEIAAMKRLESAWRDFGGPPAGDIFVEFGITAEEFYRRLHGQRDAKADPQPRQGTP